MAGAVLVIACLTTGCSVATMMLGTGAKRPAITEFGLGPRTSANRLYTATLEPAEALKPRRLQSVRITVVDSSGLPVEGAAMTIGGGMPQHGHGLPTRPRMTRAVAAGTYEIEGVRFNMGGWWEFKVTIATARGEDTVTFNLSL
ncbi:MAG TPA: FixH family protein [Vicinamibacterales bacterium]|nr:FixH family protein [Vicinamibacterales bacterium]